VAVAGPASAATQNPNVVLTQRAYKTMAAGDTSEAIAQYTKAIESRELEPEVLANALLNRALGYQKLDQQQQAIDDYTAALRLDAMSPQLRATALFNRALSYQKVNRPAMAIEDYTSALFLDSGFAHAYFGRANVLRDSGQYLFALSDYEKALQNKYPDTARLYFNQALAYEALQRPQNMRQALSLALAANPSYGPAQQKLAALNGGTELAAPQLAALGSPSQGGTLVARKSKLPEATAPSAELLADNTATATTAPVQTAAAAPKKIEDRIPMEEGDVTASVDQPAAAPAKVVAVEPVADDAVSDTAPAPEAAPVAEAAPEAAPITGWVVQIASAASEDAAWSTWKKMQKSHRVLSDKTPVVVKADLGAKGVFYRVRLTGYEGQDAAKSACSALKSGGVKCYVSKANS
jgi:tetratricopeptide (TPR) repeat protein